MAARAGLGHAEHFAFEQEAALQIGLLLPKLSLGCLKLLEARQGCSAAGGRQEDLVCSSSARFIWKSWEMRNENDSEKVMIIIYLI